MQILATKREERKKPKPMMWKEEKNDDKTIISNNNAVVPSILSIRIQFMNVNEKVTAMLIVLVRRVLNEIRSYN